MSASPQISATQPVPAAAAASAWPSRPSTSSRPTNAVATTRTLLTRDELLRQDPEPARRYRGPGRTARRSRGGALLDGLPFRARTVDPVTARVEPAPFG